MQREVISKKEGQVESLVKKLNDCEALFFTEYRGITAFELSEFRKILKQLNGVYKISKNTLLKRAFNQVNINCPNEFVIGPTGVVFSSENSSEMAKKVVGFSKSNNALQIKGGYIGSNFLTENEVRELSKLPSKEVLISQFIGGLKNSITRLVVSLNSPISGFVYSLEAIKNKK